MRRLLAGVLIAVMLVGLAFAGTSVKDGSSITSDPSSVYFRQSYSNDTVVPVSKDYPLPTALGIESSGPWATARNNVVANDTATTYGTNDAGNFSISGYNHVRFRIFPAATTDTVTFACGTATPVTNPYYGYTVTTTISGYSPTNPFICSCDSNGQTVMFPRFTALSPGANVTSVKYQGYN